MTNTCYKLHTLVAAWDTAQSQCQEEGGDLVSMTTRKKFDEFRNIEQTAGNTCCSLDDIKDAFILLNYILREINIVISDKAGCLSDLLTVWEII